VDRLDPGLSKRPSRFDRKYKFSLPNRTERIMYCDFWRHKLKPNKSIKFPKKLCAAIADITEDFSFAYLKEAFIATLLVIAGNREDGNDSDNEDDGDGDGDDLDGLILWIEMKKQVKLLREDMDSGDDESAIANADTKGKAEADVDVKPMAKKGLYGRAEPRRHFGHRLPGSWPVNRGSGSGGLSMPDGGEGTVMERLDRMALETRRGMQMGKRMQF
jgi:hypothetical protein